MLSDIIEYFHKKLGLFPVVGVELEFYIEGLDSPASYIAELSEQLYGHFDIHKENCENQYEIRSVHTEEIQELLSNLLNAKSLMFDVAASHGAVLDFSAKPYLDRAGSAFHVHINVADKNLKNLFFIDELGTKGTMIMNCIGGLCSAIKEHMLFFAPNESSYLRYAYPDIHTPTTISWGGNNRSTALRLPQTTSTPEKCRIEHRVPGADCDYATAISAILIGIIRGIEQEITPPERIFGIASDPQYRLEKLPSSLQEAQSLYVPLSL